MTSTTSGPGRTGRPTRRRPTTGRRRAMLTVAGAVLAAATMTVVHAHHSYGATYDVNREITLEGKLVRFVFRNPHSFVHVEARDEHGVDQRWSVEWSGTSQLANQGVTRESLKVGDEVVIVGRPSRVPGEYRALMVRLTRASDGFSWGTRTGEAVE